MKCWAEWSIAGIKIAGIKIAGIKIAGRSINNFIYADDTTLMVESEEELEPLDESERGEWRSLLKTQHSEN